MEQKDLIKKDSNALAKEPKEALSKAIMDVLVHLGLPIASMTLTPFLVSNPVWIAPFLGAAGLLKIALDCYDNRLKEIIRFIKKNSKEFTKEIVKTQEFRDAFIITLEQYLKQRHEEKRRIAQRIFLGFTSAKDRKTFELERNYNTLSLISFNGIEYLKFISKKIIPFKKQKIKEKQDGKVQMTETDKRWLDNTGKNSHLSYFLSWWLHNEYNPNSEKVKKKYNYNGNNDKLLNKIFAKRKPHLKKKEEVTAEFISLGILRSVDLGSSTLAGDSTKAEELTEFGKKFIRFMKN